MSGRKSGVFSSFSFDDSLQTVNERIEAVNVSSGQDECAGAQVRVRPGQPGDSGNAVSGYSDKVQNDEFEDFKSVSSQTEAKNLPTRYFIGEDAIKLHALFRNELKFLEKTLTIEGDNSCLELICKNDSMEDRLEKEFQKLDKQLKELRSKRINCESSQCRLNKEEVVDKMKYHPLVLCLPDANHNSIKLYSRDDVYLKSALVDIQGDPYVYRGKELPKGAPKDYLTQSPVMFPEYGTQGSIKTKFNKQPPLNMHNENMIKTDDDVVKMNTHVYGGDGIIFQQGKTSGLLRNRQSRYEDALDVKFQFRTTLGLTVKIYKASITRVKANAIVSSTNEKLFAGGGISKAISDAAGLELDSECQKFITERGRIPIAENCVTSPGNLPVDAVIHAVAPIWSVYTDKEECLTHLKETVKNILHTAVVKMFKTVAMPPISSGVFGVPKHMCAAMYVSSIFEFCDDCYDLQGFKEFHIIDTKDDVLNLIVDKYRQWDINKHSLSIWNLLYSQETGSDSYNYKASSPYMHHKRRSDEYSSRTQQKHEEKRELGNQSKYFGYTVHGRPYNGDYYNRDPGSQFERK